MRLPLRAALAMLAIALPCSVPDGASAQQPRSGSRALLDTVVPMSASGTVDLSNVGGRISVTGWDRSEVRVVATGAMPQPRPAPRPGGDRDEAPATGSRSQVRFHAAPDRVSVSVEHEHGAQHGDTRYEVSVPAGARVLMHSLTGELIGEALRGEVEARTMSGSIRLTGVERATANTMSGSVRVSGAGGGVRASAVTGSVIVEDAGGDIDASSTSGNVTIRSARARSLKAGSMSGNVHYEGTLDRQGRYEMQSHSGNVSLVLPPDASAVLAAETFSGNITSDFTVVLEPGTVSTQRRFELSIGGGAAAGPRVTATSFSGNIAVRRAAAGSSGSARESRRSSATGTGGSLQMESVR